MSRAPRARRAAALLVTGLALVATSISRPHTPLEFEAATTCGPAGRVALQGPAPGCGGDPSWEVSGGPAVGLPALAEAIHAGGDEDAQHWLLAGPVVLPGTEPPVTVRRVCRVGPLLSGVRTIGCQGEGPEAACQGTLTAVSPSGTRAAP